MSDASAPIVVTGAAGYIGGALVRRLARTDEVIGVDLRVPPAPPCEAVRLDVTDREALTRLMRRVRPRAIVHLAALGSVVDSMDDPAPYLHTNIGGTASVAVAAVAAGVRRVVFTSTGGALYGEPGHSPVTEAEAPVPVSVYGATKLAAEHVLAGAAAEQHLEVSVLRPGNVYGGATAGGRLGVIDLFARLMLAGRPVTLYGTGAESRDYVEIDDVVGALQAALVEAPATCNIATGIAHSNRQIFDRLAAHCGYPDAPRFEPMRRGEFSGFALAPTRAEQLWGWRPAIDFDAGTLRVIAESRPPDEPRVTGG